MTELARHLEILLLENDCVILPGLGGFITHYSPARWIEEEELYLPPVRTIGFNPQLKLNDGLLIQSYMQQHDISFSKASLLIEDAIAELQQQLREDGKIFLNGIGELHLSIDNSYKFQPTEDGVTAPGLYGLYSFGIQQLIARREPATIKTVPTIEINPTRKDIKQPTEEKKHYELHISRSAIRYTTAVAATILLFFMFSTPIENPYIGKENQAHLFSYNIDEVHPISSLISKSSEKRIETPADTETQPMTTPTEEKVEEETTRQVATSVQEAAPATPAPGRYNVIVASLGAKEDPSFIINRLSEQGYSQAQVLEGDGRRRISLQSFASKSEALRFMSEIKQIKQFKDAWLLPVSK